MRGCAFESAHGTVGRRICGCRRCTRGGERRRKLRLSVGVRFDCNRRIGAVFGRCAGVGLRGQRRRRYRRQGREQCKRICRWISRGGRIGFFRRRLWLLLLLLLHQLRRAVFQPCAPGKLRAFPRAQAQPEYRPQATAHDALPSAAASGRRRIRGGDGQRGCGRLYGVHGHPRFFCATGLPCACAPRERLAKSSCCFCSRRASVRRNVASKR